MGVLVILECEGKEYTILTYQARVPVADHNLPEIPAGMLDGSGERLSVANRAYSHSRYFEIRDL